MITESTEMVERHDVPVPAASYILCGDVPTNVQNPKSNCVCRLRDHQSQSGIELYIVRVIVATRS